jgi:hypothetical protein
MISVSTHRFGAIRTHVLIGLFAIGLVACTAVPALAEFPRAPGRGPVNLVSPFQNRPHV